MGDLARSIRFWCGACGFSVEYARDAEGFAYLARGTAEVMLEQAGMGRNWATGPLEYPLGRGINLQITVADIEPILKALRAADHPLFMEPETKWYRAAVEDAGVRQFVIVDPDGYLLRFQASIGRRPAEG